MKKTMMMLTTAVLLGFGTASAAPWCSSMSGGFGGRGHGYGVIMMEERLGLSDQQSEKVEELQSNQFRKVSAERRALAALERDLQSESLKAKVDNKKIDQLSEKIGKRYAALVRLRSAHIAEVAAILTPTQRDSMRSMMGSRPMRGSGMMMQNMQK
jgi:Spy/CpxP family protein refolding chaperone